MGADDRITVSVGEKRNTQQWEKREYSIGEFYSLCGKTKRSNETLAEYLELPKSEQDARKDVGGFVGGELDGGRRRKDDVLSRSLVTLDLDSIPAGNTEEVWERVKRLGVSFCIYSTRKHCPEKPRLRVILPSDQPMSPEKYEPVARWFAKQIGIEWTDPTTFDLNRLMYWPSTCKGAEFFYRCDGQLPRFKVDGVLGMYTDWKRVEDWPRVPGEEKARRASQKKQGNPEKKPGIIGAFNRCYGILAAIETFIPDAYRECGDDRLTYNIGSTTGGAILYEKDERGDWHFLYSHHATDPCRGELVNSFDLVRLHKFLDKDADVKPGTPVNRLPSFEAMCDFALKDPRTVQELHRYKQEEAAREFEGIGKEEDPPDAEDHAWMSKLIVTSSGQYARDMRNYALFLEHDKQLAGKIWMDSFSMIECGTTPLPWDARRKSSGETFRWADSDDASLRKYLMNFFNGVPKSDLEDVLKSHFANHTRNLVAEYLQGLTWDGEPRLETLFIKYLDADDSVYTREATRKMFCAAVARACKPGTKFDNMLVLCGPQGAGKSTILRRMAEAAGKPDYFNDSLRTFDGKEAAETIQGSWIVEVAELSAFRKSETDRIKAFMSQCADTYRAAYGRRVGVYPRTCVFFGTTNDFGFLRDATGNRRYWPIDVHGSAWTPEKDAALITERDQIWAEAYALHKGERLFLTGEALRQSVEAQKKHDEIDPFEDEILPFLEKKIPADWDSWSEDRRKGFWLGDVPAGVELVERRRVSIHEIFKEKFPKVTPTQQETNRVGRILRKYGWKPLGVPTWHGIYGSQRVFYKPAEEDQKT